MTPIREQLAALAYAFKSNNCLVPFKDQGDLLKAECYAHVDAMLDRLTANPGRAVLEIGRSIQVEPGSDALSRSFEQMRERPSDAVHYSIDSHVGERFCVMIQAIKEGK